MNRPTYIEEALRRIDSEIFAEPNQMKIILQKELQGLGERIIEEAERIHTKHYAVWEPTEEQKGYRHGFFVAISTIEHRVWDEVYRF